METFFAIFLFFTLLSVFGFDASRKRREYIRKQDRA
jgi:hypothetical protein